MKERITAVAFVSPVDFLGLMGEHTWRADKHGPEPIDGRGVASRASVGQGIVTIEPIGARPPGKDGEGARWRTVRVPITNVRYWHVETEPG